MTDDAAMLQRKRGAARLGHLVYVKKSHASMRAGFGAKKAAQVIEAELKRRKEAR